MHQQMASDARSRIGRDRRAADGRPVPARRSVCPQWPMIVLRRPKRLDRAEGRRRVEDRRLSGARTRCRSATWHKPEHIELLEGWMKSYRPQELFDEGGKLRPEIAALAPTGDRRMSANPHANGGLLRRELVLPDFADYAVPVDQPGQTDGEATRIMGLFLRDIIKERTRIFGFLARTRPSPIALPRSSMRPTGNGWRRPCPRTIIWPRTARSWRS